MWNCVVVVNVIGGKKKRLGKELWKMIFRLGFEWWVDFENWKGEGRVFSKVDGYRYRGKNKFVRGRN